MPGLCQLYGRNAKMCQVFDSCMEEFPRCARSVSAVWKSFQDVSGLCPLYRAASKMWQVCDNCIEEFPRYVGFLIAVWRSFLDV